PALRAKQAELREAAARVDQALIGFFPRLTISAGYSYQNPIENALGSAQGPSSVIATRPDPTDTRPLPNGPITVTPCPDNPANNCYSVLDPANPAAPPQAANLVAIAPQRIVFPVITNNWQLAVSLSVPISDYVLRLSQSYSASVHAQNAKKLEVQAQGLQVAADAKIAFYNWVLARGNVVVTAESVAQARAHLEDARLTFEVGRISRADVLGLEAQVAAAEQAAVQTEAFLMIAEEQLRQALGSKPDQRMEIGIDVFGAPPAPPADALQALQQEALRRRLEIRALDETIYSLKEVESVTAAGYLPRVDATANLLYANPNPRVFPQTQEFRATWDAGVRLTWVLNDTIGNIPAMEAARARTAQIQEQKNLLRDGLRLEVASAYSDLLKASSQIDASERQLVAALEAMRVRTELFRAGRATSTDLIDAENRVTQARLQRINARVGLLAARTRLEHAVGRDVDRGVK
ncbi:MAG TPA: TolC family protein, partial [Candidatus Nanopelagicales bacterium]|nr:TolC family protein [Candidatus Nanopelagicales bacterium]